MEIAIHSFDYGAGAELSPTNPNPNGRDAGRSDTSVLPKRPTLFSSPSKAARRLPGQCWLEVGDDRFNASDIRRLYDDEAYPLDRQELHPQAPIVRLAITKP
jgi:hypothetical protein